LSFEENPFKNNNFHNARRRIGKTAKKGITVPFSIKVRLSLLRRIFTYTIGTIIRVRAVVHISSEKIHLGTPAEALCKIDDNIFSSKSQVFFHIIQSFCKEKTAIQKIISRATKMLKKTKILLDFFTFICYNKEKCAGREVVFT